YYKVEITLPSPVDFKKSRAKLKHGILEIELPKKIKYYKVKVE
ncbi:MAG TPA: Hsp20/alpha crystallin family protein, partial [Thermofilum sp.]|nr:Hsp20/alpha crystallin family protein [Thermofilum sp.]